MNVIQRLVPDVLVKGGDWAEDEINGSDAVRKSGGVVKTIKFIEGLSTTNIREKIRIFSDLQNPPAWLVV